MDLDADGNLDLLSGSYSRMEQPMAGLFQVLWGKQDGKFRTAEPLRGTDDKPLVIPHDDPERITESICTRPFAVDWDHDGDLDLVVGTFSGTFYLFTGEGKGKFNPKPQPIKTGDDPLTVPGLHGDPFVVDWDNDGDLDVLSGSGQGGVFLAENTAGAKNTPKLKPFKALIEADNERAAESRPEEVRAPDRSTRVWAADMTGDGKLDLLVGDMTVLISPKEGVSEAEFQKRYAEWREKNGRLMQEMSKAQEDANPDPQDPDALAKYQEMLEPYYERMNKLDEQRSEFLTEERTGFVWLYAQK